jgi:predicted  nucleic acid-binding Zn-ribbon protein
VIVKRAEERLFDIQDQKVKEEKDLEKILKKSSKDKEKAKQELQAVENLVEQSEDKYIECEIKVKKISEKADKEQDRIASAKKRFEAWKIGVLEEVARLKLKNKVDNIDKAGLSDILNG